MVLVGSTDLGKRDLKLRPTSVNKALAGFIPSIRRFIPCELQPEGSVHSQGQVTRDKSIVSP